MIIFDFRDLHMDPQTSSHRHDAILGVTGRFGLLVRGKVLYSEVDFPLIEFARAMLTWLRQIDNYSENFEYESMETAELRLVWVRREGEGWRIGSVNQEYPEMTVFSVEDIKSAFDDFIERLQHRCRTDLQLEISELLQDVP